MPRKNKKQRLCKFGGGGEVGGGVAEGRGENKVHYGRSASAIYGRNFAWVEGELA